MNRATALLFIAKRLKASIDISVALQLDTACSADYLDAV